MCAVIRIRLGQEWRDWPLIHRLVIRGLFLLALGAGWAAYIAAHAIIPMKYLPCCRHLESLQRPDPDLQRKWYAPVVTKR